MKHCKQFYLVNNFFLVLVMMLKIFLHIAPQVLKVCASKRTGKENFITCMRHTLAGRYGDQPVGMGGVFGIEKGKAKIHIMVSKCTNNAS